MLSLAFFTVMVYSTVVSSQTVNPPDNIFILAGQSNMAGRGGAIHGPWDGIVPPECRPNPLILRLSAALTWEEAHEPLHKDIDTKKICGVGPGMPFSNSVLEWDPTFGVIGLVPCAIGGTSITEWKPGGTLYNQLITRAQVALQGGAGTIRAILWYQGESDATNSTTDAMLYENRLIEFVNDVRCDLKSPLVPFIQVALASGKNSSLVEVVRQAQIETCAFLPNVICVDAKGLTLETDNLHLTTASQVQLGKMLANAFLNTIWLK